MGITDHEIRGAIELGCGSVADLTRDLGVGTCCGKCLPEASRLVRHCGGCVPVLRAVGGDD